MDARFRIDTEGDVNDPNYHVHLDKREQEAQFGHAHGVWMVNHIHTNPAYGESTGPAKPAKEPING